MKYITLLFFLLISITSNASELAIKKINSENLENLLEVQKGLLSGGEPKTEKSFKELSQRGVKVIVSVDGAIPKVDFARKYGMRYIHIPIGYDELSEETLLSIKSLAIEVDEKLFIHCHHGRHRGPTVAAIFLMEKEVCQNGQSLKLLEKAGTGEQYTGLWSSVKDHVIQKADKPLPELLEVAQVDSMVESMAKIDRLYDNLKASKNLNWQALPDNPDFSAVHGALIMKEFLRESARTLSDSDTEQKKFFTESENIAALLENSLKTNNRNAANKHLSDLRKSCIKCHKKFRN